jgi:hypothetical protein
MQNQLASADRSFDKHYTEGEESEYVGPPEINDRLNNQSVAQ